MQTLWEMNRAGKAPFSGLWGSPEGEQTRKQNCPKPLPLAGGGGVSQLFYLQALTLGLPCCQPVPALWALLFLFPRSQEGLDPTQVHPPRLLLKDAGASLARTRIHHLPRKPQSRC